MMKNRDLHTLDTQRIRPADVLITDKLSARSRKTPNLSAEVAAFQELSGLLVRKPERAVKRFLELAVTLCDAGSAGLSLLEDLPDGGRQFRWDAMAGPLDVHVGGTTPFDFSPCGMCLSQGRTILVSRPFRAFPYFEVVVQPLMEGLVVPLYDTGGVALGTIWIVHHDIARHFDAEDARVMEQLAIQMVLALKFRQEKSNDREVEALKADNAALLDSAGFLRGVLASSGDCIKVLDLDANLIFMSEGGQRVMEVSDFSAIRGCSWLGFWNGKAKTEALAAVEAAKAGGIGRFQNLANTMAGTPKWWDVQITPILDAEGNPETLLCVSRDITETRKALADLRDSQGLNALILSSSRDCIVVLDLEGITQFVSPGGIEAMEIVQVEAILGLSWLRVWKGDDHDAARAAVAEARAGGIGRFQGFCPTHQGKPKWWDVVISPLRGPDGAPVQLVSIGRDITEYKLVAEQLASSETALRLATEAAEVGTWDLDLTTDVLVWSDRTKAIFGISPDVPCSMNDFYAGLHAEDLRATSEAFASALDPLRRATYDVEYRTVGKEDGIIRWVAAKGRGIFNAQGRCIRAVGTAIDISARKEAEERQRLLTLELNHRMKNTLAMVQAIGNQTMRTSNTMAEARAAFNERLHALGRAQDILTRTSWSRAGMREVIRGALDAHGGTTGRFTFEGPELRLTAKCGLALALALHELATNAAKYGALSNDTGGVRVSWGVASAGTEQQFRLEWLEHGGPPVMQPSREGFGSRMIERSLAGYFSGSAKLVYQPAGVIFSLEAPLSALTAE